jgi:hypothetical protein
MCTDPVKVSNVANGPNKGWNLQHCLESGGPGHYPVLSAAYNDHPTFTFQIVGQKMVYFANDPVWVAVGTAKPTKLDAGLIGPVSGAGTRTISFQDLNHSTGPQTLTYTLRFSDGTATDPIIQNGGCCHVVNSFLPTTTETFVVELAIAFLVGVLVAIAVQRLRRA